MTSPVKGRSFFYSPLVLYALAAAFVFTLGFLIVFGRQAHASKSWHYVMPDGDPLYYWSVAKGRMMTPRCDCNPFYFEEQGTRHIIPFTTAEAVGLLSKYTRVPLSWLFPAWHILMPVITWLVLVLCCWKLWGYPLDICAPGVLILLLMTLFCPWAGVYTTLIRFSRPLDGIAPLFLWISLIFRGDPRDGKQGVAIILTSFLTLWLQPYNAALGLWVTAIEYVYSRMKGKRWLAARLNLLAIGSCIVSGLLFAGYVFFGKNTDSSILDTQLLRPQPIFYVYLTVLILLVFIAAVLLLRFCFKREVTPLDRLVIEWAFFGTFAYVISRWIPAAREAPIHMLYFAVPILFFMAGWIYEKLAVFQESRFLRRFIDAFVCLLFGVFLFMLIIRKNPFAVATSEYFVYVPQYFLILFFALWLLARFELLRRIVTRKAALWALILVLALAGYWKIPVYQYNRDFPFDGGYQWLKRNAQENDVVLTAAADSRFGQYLFLETGLKSYYYLPAGTFTRPAQAYRADFVLGLLLGLLKDLPGHESWSLEQKLHHFKLDYILIPMPSPFSKEITTQLQGHLQEVYQDPRCLLWKVT